MSGPINGSEDFNLEDKSNKAGGRDCVEVGVIGVGVGRVDKYVAHEESELLATVDGQELSVAKGNYL